MTWVHSKLKKMGLLDEDWTLTQCLFGEHLLACRPDAVVGLVEAEKTAVICAALLPGYVWIATGGLDQWGDKLMVLKGHKVVAFPDADGYATWLRKAAEFRSLGITVSDLLERSCTPEQRALKVDIADLLLEGLEHPKDNQFKTPLPARISDRISSDYRQDVERLIDELGLEVIAITF